MFKIILVHLAEQSDTVPDVIQAELHSHKYFISFPIDPLHNQFNISYSFTKIQNRNLAE